MCARARVGGALPRTLTSMALHGDAIQWHDVVPAVRVSVKFSRALLVLLSWATPALAHSWYDARCCSGHDCHPVPCERLHAGPVGSVVYLPTNLSFFKENVLPSQDAQCHICTSRPATDTGYGYCVYIQQGF